MKKVHTPGRLHICSMLALLILFWSGLSCSSLTKVHLQKFYEARLDITIVIEEFFVRYLSDLTGASTLDQLIDEKELKEYLYALDAVYAVGISYNERSNAISMQITTSNFIATLLDMDVVRNRELIKLDMQEVEFEFSREVLREIITHLPRYNNPSLIHVFFPDTIPFANNDYAGYLAWALNDYASETVILDRIINSSMEIELKKEEGFGVIPDKNWKRGRERNTQRVSYPFVEMMTGTELNLHLTF